MENEVVHFLAIDVKPTSAVPGAEDIGGAQAIVCVREDDPAEAEAKALEYLMDQGWLIEAVERAHAPTPEQIAQLDAVMMALYHCAMQEGIHCMFSAWPKNERPEDAEVETRSLPLPPSWSDTKN